MVLQGTNPDIPIRQGPNDFEQAPGRGSNASRSLDLRWADRKRRNDENSICSKVDMLAREWPTTRSLTGARRDMVLTVVQRRLASAQKGTPFGSETPLLRGETLDPTTRSLMLLDKAPLTGQN